MQHCIQNFAILAHSFILMMSWHCYCTAACACETVSDLERGIIVQAWLHFSIVGFCVCPLFQQNEEKKKKTALSGHIFFKSEGDAVHAGVLLH